MALQHLLLLREEDVELANKLIPHNEQHKYRAYYFSLKIEQALSDSNFERLGMLSDTVARHWRDDSQLSDQIARTYDSEIAILRESAFDVPHGLGWHYLNFGFITNCLLRIKRASDQLRRVVPLRGDILVPWCMSPPDYYFDSELLRSISVDALRGADNRLIKLKFDHSRSNNPAAYHNIPTFPTTAVKHIVHLPTASYDYRSHASRLESKAANSVDIQSPYFDVPILRERACLTERARNIITREYAAAIARLTERVLEGIVDKLSLPALINRTLERENFQINTLLALRSAASLNGANTLDITDHDAALQGPLMTFAAERNLEVNVWPHSTVCVQPFPSSSQTTKNHCVTDENRYTRLGTTNANIQKLSFPQARRIFPRNRNILLLHNELEDISGITKIDIPGFLVRYRDFKRKLHDSGLVYRIRHKPKHSYVDALGDNGEPLAQGHLSDWFTWAGVCISFGELSTALIKLAQADCYCVHVSFGAISAVEMSSMPPNTQLFEENSCCNGFAALENWIDSELLQR